MTIPLAMLSAVWYGLGVLRGIEVFFEVLRALVRPAQPVQRSGLDSEPSPQGRITVYSSIERSKALGELLRLVIQRTQNTGATELEKDAMKKAIFHACSHCYTTGLSRTRVQKSIKAVISEHLVPVS